MKIGFAQINPTVGDLQGNFEKIATAYDQLAEAGVDYDDVTVVQGRSDATPYGPGTGGSRTAVVARKRLFDAVGAAVASGKPGRIGLTIYDTDAAPLAWTRRRTYSRRHTKSSAR